ncbi:GGDEF domain-containing protein [Cellulomonas cellasea]|uniref:Diguanylate cyclase (GGDEF)-like protein n=1 Tax=Cellulomonas cellasea TaxID=43670 RepID=A0A7W4UJS4_9CELL|nr:GGDEF domain-containing protein [Cellulomonas cellasea]MBB2924828.1 diguanylate cyclase (GGDEF)-like protein [Cellulomonas cellasea]
MPQDRRLVQAVARLSAAATRDADAGEMLRELCVAAARAIPVDSVGVMEVELRDGRRDTVRFVAVEGRVAPAEAVQEALQLGPCHDAVVTQDVVVVDDLGRMHDAWGPFVTTALAVEVQAVVAVPLLSRAAVWGTLDMYRRTAGPWDEHEIEAARLLADVAVSYLVMAHDRDEARAARREIEHRALHDQLTGLPNRSLLFDRMAHAVAATARTGKAVAVAFLDLDGFKGVNDTLGHAGGDVVLVEVARRLLATARTADTLSRLAGDEFVLLCEDIPPEPEPRARAVRALTERLGRAFGEPVRVGGTSLAVTASVGVVVTRPDAEASPETLLHAADSAMYEAKAHGPGAVVVHDRVESLSA